MLFALVALLTRRTALGMLIESVGDQPEASRLAGIRSRRDHSVRSTSSSRVCAGIAGLMISSNVTAPTRNNAGLWIELDAILAVVIGGTSLAGGRFSLAGTVLGALIIQTLTTTVYTMGIPPEITLVFKAVVVIVVCLLQSPRSRALLRRRRHGEPAGQDTGPAVPPPELASATTATDSPSAPDAVGTSTTRNKVTQP